MWGEIENASLCQFPAPTQKCLSGSKVDADRETISSPFIHACIHSLIEESIWSPPHHSHEDMYSRTAHTHTHTCSAEFLRLSHTHSLSPCLPPPFPRTSHKLQERHSTETVSERILLPVNPHRRLLCLHHCVVRSCLLTILNDDFGTQEREEKVYCY